MNVYPKISVCIPTYNYGKFIADSIDSVILQTFKNFELIIVDNCSDDETEEIVKKYINIYDNIKYFRNKTNVGMTANWNRCLELSSGEYVKILCADDLLLPNCLEKSIEALDENIRATLMASSRTLVDENLEPYGCHGYGNLSQTEIGFETIKNCFINGNLIGEPSSVVFRKKNSARGFSGDFTQLTDIEMWFNILEQGDFVYLHEKLCKIRKHDDQETKINIKKLVFIDEEFELLRRYSKKNYMNLTEKQKDDAKFNKSLILWGLKNHENKNQIKQKISQNYNLIFFYRKLFLRKMIKSLQKSIFKLKNNF